MYTTPRTTHTSTEILTSIKLYVILLLSLLLVSCGGGGGGAPGQKAIGSTESTISLNVTKGPVAGASCILTDSAGNNTTQSNKTDPTGHSENTAKIAAGALTIACSDGSYTDEATGSVIDAPTMHALGYHPGNNFSATVSPLSEIVYQRTIALTKNVASLTATEIGNEHQKIATLFGLEGIDILNTVPTPLVGTGAEPAANDGAGKFAIVLAGLSQLFFENYGTATEEVAQGIRALAIDLADGTFDAKDDLRTAIEAFDEANKNSLGYNDKIVPELIAAIGSATTTTLTAVVAPVLSITTDIDTSPVYTVGATITPLVFNSTATNGGATECSISALPPGLQLNGTTKLSAPATSSGTCELTGTPTTASSSTEYTLTVGNIRATDSATIEIIVNKGTQAPLTNPSPTTATFGDDPLTVSVEGGSGDGKTITATSSSNTDVATVSGRQITITGAGNTTITLTKAGDDNYLPVTTTYTLTVDRAPLTLTFNNNQIIQHSNTAGNLNVSSLALTGNTGNGLVSYSLTNNTNNIGAITQAGVFTPQGTNIGTATLVVSVAETTNYLAGSTSVILDVIDKIKQSSSSLTFTTDPLTVVYSPDGTITDRTATPNVGGVGELTYSSSNQNVATVNQTTGEVTIVSAGKTIITATLSGDDTYAPLPKQYELTVTKAEQALLSDPTPTTATFGDGQLEVSAGGGSIDGGTITATSSSNTDVATVSNGKIVITGAGTTTITITKEGNNNYRPIDATYTFTVDKAPRNLRFNNDQIIQHAKKAGDLDVSIFLLTGNTGTATVSYSLENNTNNIGTITEEGIFTPQGTNTGTATLVVSVAEATNYLAGSTSVILEVIDKIAQSGSSLTFTTDSLTVAYSLNGTITTRTATSNDGIGALTYSSSSQDVATVNSTTGVVTIVSVGTTTITAMLSGDDIYAPLSKQYELTVTQGEQAPLNNTGTTTATFGDDPLTVSAEGGSIDGGTITATSSSNESVATVSDTQITITGAGTTTITITKAGDDNYLPIDTTYTLTVSKAPRNLRFNNDQIIQHFKEIDNLDVSTFLLTGNTDTATVSYSLTNNTNNIGTITEEGIFTPQGTNIGTATLVVSIAETTNYFSGSTSVVLEVTDKMTQSSASLTFTTDPLTVAYSLNGTITTRTATSDGIGTLTYSSSSQDVATVNSTTGVVTIASVGKTIITATLDGGDTYAPLPKQYELTVIQGTQAPLSNPSPTTATFGVAPLTVNAEGGSIDGGTITATSSSNTDVATVSNGKIDIKGVGTTIITLTKAGNDNYLPIDTTYTFTVIPSIAKVTAQVGVRSSTMQITNPTSSTYTVYLSQNTYCDPEKSKETCDDTQTIPANDSIEFTANALALHGSPTFGILQNTLDQYGEFSIELDKFSKRSGHQIVEVNGDLYLIGGDDGSNKLNDVWKSTDNGQRWAEILPHNANVTNGKQFSPRSDHQVVVKDGAMYLIGGNDNDDSNKNDVWKSTNNGKTWVEVLPHKADATPEDNQFSPRTAHQVVVKGDYMYLIAGYDGSNSKRFNDLWKSSNGITWVQVDTNNTLEALYDHQVVVKGDSLYVIGGRTYENKNTVWQFIDDEQIWTQISRQNVVDTKAKFTPRIDHQVVVLGNNMYVIGGNDGSRKNDVWKSSDGKDWERVETTNHIFTQRDNHQVVVIGDTMYLIGGVVNNSGGSNDVWKSTNGEDWQLVTNVGAEFAPREYHQVVEMNGELYLIGGDDDLNKNDIWKSSDTGKTWTQVETSGDIFSPRRKHQVVVKDNTLYVIGGHDGLHKNDVWKSDDQGVTWNKSNILAPFAPRDSHQVVVIGNTMYLIGGWINTTDKSGRSNDIWQSSNGENWESVNTNPAFSARYGHQVVTINDVMYLIGGNDGTNKNDVWKSENQGVTWAPVTPNPTSAIFAPRRNHQVVVMSSTMYVIGGYDDSGRFDDVWESTDQGVTWTKISDDANSNTIFTPRQGHQVVVVGDGDNATMLVIGGSDADSSYRNDVWSSADGKNWFLHVQATVTLKKDQPKLSHTGAISATFGDAPLEIETTGGGGTAAVRASSSNTDVAQVVDGKIIITGAGTTTITLTKAGDVNYYETIDTYTLTVNKLEQAALTNPTPTTVTFGVAPFAVNAQGGSGDGKTITATNSSNHSVAQVSEDGNVVIKGAGTTTITIIKAGDNVYLPSDAIAYTLTVLPPNVATITAQLGVNTSTIQLTNPTSGEYTVYLSQGTYCDPTNSGLAEAECDDTRIIPAYESIEFTRTALTLGSTPTFGVLQNTLDQYGKFSISSADTSSGKFSKRNKHQVVAMNGDLYLIGGTDGSKLNDVWKSSDKGKSWTQVLAHTNTPDNTQFSPRDAHQVVVKDNTLYVIGGADKESNSLNDVWSSTDGVTWEKLTNNAAFSPRSSHQVVVKGDTMYLIGGSRNELTTNDVWKSTNGKDWNPVLDYNDAPDETQFSPRYGHQVVVKGDTMYLIGGRHNANGIQNDFWKSDDGKTWEKIETSGHTESISPAGRTEHQVVVKGDNIYVIGGYIVDDVWESSDGANWTRILPDSSTNTRFSPRYGHQVVVVGDGDDSTMLVIGGLADGRTNDVWSSTDGRNWSLHVQLTVPLKKDQPELSNTGETSATVGDAPLEIKTIGGTGAGAVRASSSNTDVAQVVDGKIIITGAGTTTITLTKAGDVNYYETIDTYTLTVNKLEQAALTNPTPTTVTFGVAPFAVNAQGGSGDGKTITATNSSNHSVAQVSEDGNVVIKGAGTTTITIIKAGDNVYLPSDAIAYTLTVLPPNVATITAQLGVNTSTIQLTNPTSGEYTVYLSQGTYCDPTNSGLAEAECDDTRIIPAYESIEFTRTALTLGSTPTFGVLQNTLDQYGKFSISSADTSSGKFSKRNKHQVVEMNGDLYLIGGTDGLKLNDVWKSSDKGKTWTQVLAHTTTPNKTQFSLRSAHRVVVKDNTLYVIGGFDDSKSLNDVWSSTDGVTWKELTNNAAFSPRYSHQVVVKGDTMYLIGGFDGSNRFNDVWESTNGKDWNPVLDHTSAPDETQFSPRYSHQVVVKGDTMYLIGGWTDSGMHNDVWKSSDNGKTWLNISPNDVTDTTKFSPRWFHQVVVKGEYMYLIGGSTFGGRTNGVWRSDNGESWTRISMHNVNNTNKFSPINDHQVVVVGDGDSATMLVIGGSSDYSLYRNDVWSSTDGRNWSLYVQLTVPLKKDQPEFSNTGAISATFGDDPLTVSATGGTGTGIVSATSSSNTDVAQVVDGKITITGAGTTTITLTKAGDDNYHEAINTYTLTVTPMTTKVTAQLGANDSTMQITNPTSGSYTVYLSRDTYCDPANPGLPGAECDDIETIPANESIEFTPTALTLSTPTFGILQNTLDQYGEFSISSADMSSGKFSNRSAHQVVEMNGELYLIGGGDGSSKNDIWKSIDQGKSWTQVETTGDIFSPRHKHQVVAKGDSLYVIGGNAGGVYKNDIWKSDNQGETWTKISDDSNTPFAPRDAHQVVVIGDTMYLIGGWTSNSGISNDIWQSTDGKSWTQVPKPDDTNSIFSARYAHQVVTINDVMYLIGGTDGSNALNDIWKSENRGETWAPVTASPTGTITATIFTPRYNHQVVVMSSTMYVIGGYDDSNRFNDVWESTDQGVTWKDISADANSNTVFTPREGHQVVVVGDGDGDNATMLVIGGSDGDDSYKNDVWSSTDGSNWSLHVQATVTFKKDQPKLSNAGATSATFGDAPLEIETIGGTGAGAVRASSSNTDVAQVVDGKIVTKGAGTTTITLTKAGDANYYETINTYTLTVILSGVTTITAQVGANDSTMQVTNPTSGEYTVYLSQGTYCDPANPGLAGAECDDTETIPAYDSTEFTATALTLGGSPTFGVLQTTADQYNEFSIAVADILFDKFSKRFGHQIIEMNGDLYLIGGREGVVSSTPPKNDVWKSSNNGKTWLNISPNDDTNDNTKFSPRHGHQVVVKGDSLYVIGGDADGLYRNDVWKSTNGKDWDLVLINHPDTTPEDNQFSSRTGHQVVVKDNVMYLIGGYGYDDGSNNELNDVWKSSDNGKTWLNISPHDATDTTKFSPRWFHQVVVKGEYMYLIGGADRSSHKNDVWKSSDGANWQPVTPTGTIFSARYDHQVVVKDDALYVIGGFDGSHKNDVWKSSSDGANWQPVTPTGTIFSARYDHQVVVKDGAMYLIGGRDGSFKNDVWKSDDNGKTWTEIKSNLQSADFSLREYHQVVEMNGDLYLIGGDDGSRKNDVWKSTDTGKTWTQVKTEGTIFTPRRKHQVVAKGNTLYVIGGYDGSHKNDVWRSTDQGVTWEDIPAGDANNNTTFARRDAHQVVVIGDTMYLIGGWTADSGRSNDIWQSINGESWTQVPKPDDTNSIFSERYGHQVVTINDVMYLIGGNDNDGNKNDVWKSEDQGGTWNPVTPTSTTIFPPRRNHQVVVTGSTMYVIGGIDNESNRLNDVWKSEDQGKTWEDISADVDSNIIFNPRQGHQVVVVDGTMFVIGGHTNDGRKNDVWSSTDGKNWFLHVQVTIPLE